MGDESLQAEEYLEAVRHYETALSEATDSSSRKTITDKLDQAKVLLVDEYLDRAETALDAGSTKIAGIERAIVILEQVARYDDSQQRIADRLQRYRDKKQSTIAINRDVTAQSQQLIGQFKFEEARKELEKILSSDPNNEKLKQDLLLVLTLNKLYLEMQDALSNKELGKAIDVFQKMTDSAPVPLRFADLPERTDFVKLIISQSNSLQRQNHWWDAYLFLSKWDVDELQDELKQVRIKGAAWYSQQTRNLIKKDEIFKGYLLIDRAIQLDGKNPDIFAQHRMAGDMVDRSMQSNIAVASFDSPSNDPDAGRQFSDSLISYLYEVFPYGINILEREKIDLIKKEHTEEEDLAQILGVDLMVTGTVSLFKVDKNVDERTATVKIKVNEEIDYDKMISLFGSDRQNWPTKESQMPKKVNYENISYKKGKAELQGFSKVSVRIFDTSKGAIAFVRDYEGNVNYTSDFQDEVLDANILYKPIDLPAETEAKEKMRKEIVTQIGKVVQASFENRETRFLNQARFYIGRKEYQRALRPIAEGYLYCTKANGMDLQSCSEIRRLADELIK